VEVGIGAQTQAGIFTLCFSLLPQTASLALPTLTDGCRDMTHRGLEKINSEQTRKITEAETYPVCYFVPSVQYLSWHIGDTQKMLNYYQPGTHGSHL
jgi:hypothetical protein